MIWFLTASVGVLIFPVTVGDSETAKRRTAKEMGIATDEALNLVHKPLGPFNWALFSIDGTAIDLWDAGSLGVTEMGSLLPKVGSMSALVQSACHVADVWTIRAVGSNSLRGRSDGVWHRSGTPPPFHPSLCHIDMTRQLNSYSTFAGKFRRTKWISLWWSGADVGAHKKGSVLGTAKEKAMAKMKAPISMEGETPDDFSLEAIIDKVRRSAVIDGDGIDEKGNSWEGGPDAVFSLDAYDFSPPTNYILAAHLCPAQHHVGTTPPLKKRSSKTRASSARPLRMAVRLEWRTQ